ncbi:hypothetical protein LEMLEM_LOCUS8982 [Lemmus lemmus]
MGAGGAFTDNAKIRKHWHSSRFSLQRNAHTKGARQPQRLHTSSAFRERLSSTGDFSTCRSSAVIFPSTSVIHLTFFPQNAGNKGAKLLLFGEVASLFACSCQALWKSEFWTVSNTTSHPYVCHRGRHSAGSFLTP